MTNTGEPNQSTLTKLLAPSERLQTHPFSRCLSRGWFLCKKHAIFTEKIRSSANPTQGPRFCEKNELGSQGSSLQRLVTNRIWTPRLTGEGNQWGRTQTRVAANPLHTVEKQPRHTSHIVNFGQNASTRTIHDLTKGFAPSTNSRPTVVAASHVQTALPKLQNKSATLPGP